MHARSIDRGPADGRARRGQRRRHRNAHVASPQLRQLALARHISSVPLLFLGRLVTHFLQSHAVSRFVVAHSLYVIPRISHAHNATHPRLALELVRILSYILHLCNSYSGASSEYPYVGVWMYR